MSRTIPAIRFRGFTDDWEQRKFGDVGSVSMCKRIFKDETTDEGDIPFFKIGTFGGEPDAYISRSLFEDYKAKYPYPNKGDILLSASGTIGRMVEYNGEEAYFQDSNIVWLSHDQSIDNSYLRVLYEIVKWDGIEGSTIQRLYNDNFLKTKFLMPTKDEQQKIGNYFAGIDNLITLHQRKCDALKTLKKGMLQKMFPKNGAKVPEFRFKGFTGDWEQRKLGDVVEEFYNGQTPYRQNKTYWDGDINWLSSGDLNRGIVTHTLEKITDKGKAACGLKVVPKGTLIIAIMGLEAAGTRGNCGILAIDTTINQACMALRVDDKKISSDFLFQWYKCFGNDYALKFTQGTKQKNYNAELLANLDISYPNIEEQTKIGEYFTNLDNLITLHQHKFDALKELKKGMLQKMFPEVSA